MIKYLLIAFAWMALSYPIFRYLGPIAVVGYGVLSLVCLLVWAGTRKGSTVKK